MANVLPRQVDNATLVEELVAASFPVSVTVRRLDDVLAEHHISRIDVMDIHVGGCVRCVWHAGRPFGL